MLQPTRRMLFPISGEIPRAISTTIGIIFSGEHDIAFIEVVEVTVTTTIFMMRIHGSRTSGMVVVPTKQSLPFGAPHPMSSMGFKWCLAFPLALSRFPPIAQRWIEGRFYRISTIKVLHGRLGEQRQISGTGKSTQDPALFSTHPWGFVSSCPAREWPCPGLVDRWGWVH